MGKTRHRHKHLSGLRAMRGTDKVLLEFRGGRLELGDWGRLLGGSDIGTQGLARWGGWELAGQRKRAFQAKAWSSISNFASALERSFSGAWCSLGPYSYSSLQGKLYELKEGSAPQSSNPTDCRFLLFSVPDTLFP